MIFARIAEDFAQLADRCVQTIVEVDESICRPESLVKRLAAYQLSLLLQQGNQHLEGFLLQMKLSTAFPQFACVRVGFKRTKAKGAGKLAGTLAQSANNTQSFYTRIPMIEDSEKGAAACLFITVHGNERMIQSLNLPRYGRSLVYKPLTKAEREQLAKAGHVQTVPLVVAKK